MAKLRLMLDTNIILDVLAKREPFFSSSAKIWVAIETGQVEGYIAAHSITTIYYILAKHITKEKALSAVGDLLRVFSIAEINHSILQQALMLGWDDFKDAVQVCSAMQSGISFFITRDKIKFPSDLLVIVSPEDFLAVLHSLLKG